ncbi:MAG TPA: ubiquinol-cytochrome c reductase iron-sulfur subunit [Xanthomonadaceae bacterium]|nr:ubiquinol-cytochrome c reductase iron-sulfur subunit [Xanthomonadaceae bacterium]
MANEGVNPGRRRFITATTAVVGGVGVAFAAVPFIKSWNPSAKAQVAGAPVEVDLSKIEPGQRHMVQWRGQPVWIIRRTDAVLSRLPDLKDRLRDPDSQVSDQQPGYAQNDHRSIKPEWMVLVGLCTHLGCAPLYVPEMLPQPFDSQWQGGFFCPCHNSRFDMAGRVYQGVPAPTNLRVPPHRFLDDNLIQIGVNPEGAA